jgi:2-keto-4-pentenoate hydratase/2-oxohepta-3-ene-1,7-dioic acid hydratase in catechol pathway
MATVTLSGAPDPIAVGKILCIGRNYAEHAREMRSDVPAQPVVFIKPATTLLADGGVIVRPPFARELHHEVELVVLIGRGGKDIPRASALDHVGGYGIGLDMTLRDVQAEAKKKGLPWSVAKGFDTSAPVSAFVPPSHIPDPHALVLRLAVNGVERQRGCTGDMLFPVDLLVSYLSSVFTLERGDLVFTGTPEGVGPVEPGDRLEAALEGIATLNVGVR